MTETDFSKCPKCGSNMTFPLPEGKEMICSSCKTVHDATDREGHEGRWVTMRGTHVFIRNGETPAAALKRSIIQKAHEKGPTPIEPEKGPEKGAKEPAKKSALTPYERHKKSVESQAGKYKPVKQKEEKKPFELDEQQEGQVQKFIEKTGYDRETAERMVLGESHGDVLKKHIQEKIENIRKIGEEFKNFNDKTFGEKFSNFLEIITKIMKSINSKNIESLFNAFVGHYQTIKNRKDVPTEKQEKILSEIEELAEQLDKYREHFRLDAFDFKEVNDSFQSLVDWVIEHHLTDDETEAVRIAWAIINSRRRRSRERQEREEREREQQAQQQREETERNQAAYREMRRLSRLRGEIHEYFELVQSKLTDMAGRIPSREEIENLRGLMANAYGLTQQLPATNEHGIPERDQMMALFNAYQEEVDIVTDKMLQFEEQQREQERERRAEQERRQSVIAREEARRARQARLEERRQRREQEQERARIEHENLLAQQENDERYYKNLMETLEDVQDALDDNNIDRAGKYLDQVRRQMDVIGNPEYRNSLKRYYDIMHRKYNEHLSQHLPEHIEKLVRSAKYLIGRMVNDPSYNEKAKDKLNQLNFLVNQMGYVQRESYGNITKELETRYGQKMQEQITRIRDADDAARRQEIGLAEGERIQWQPGPAHGNVEEVAVWGEPDAWDKKPSEISDRGFTLAINHPTLKDVRGRPLTVCTARFGKSFWVDPRNGKEHECVELNYLFTSPRWGRLGAGQAMGAEIMKWADKNQVIIKGTASPYDRDERRPSGLTHEQILAAKKEEYNKLIAFYTKFGGVPTENQWGMGLDMVRFPRTKSARGAWQASKMTKEFKKWAKELGYLATRMDLVHKRRYEVFDLRWLITVVDKTFYWAKDGLYVLDGELKS